MTVGAALPVKMAARLFSLLRHAAPRPGVPVEIVRNFKALRQPIFVEDLQKLPDYEAHPNPPEWKHVESLVFPKTVPKPKPKEEYPSGWRPQLPESRKHPYYLSRNSAHMLPLYLKIRGRGMGRRTVIREIEGDIWTLSEEIKSCLESKHDRIIPVRVHEIMGQIEVKGDYYYDVQDFLYSKGF